jgi:hypothetical protein
MPVHAKKYCITWALWTKGSVLSLANRSLLESPLQTHHIPVQGSNSPVPTIAPSGSYKVVGVELNTTLKFTKHCRKLKRTFTALSNALSTSLLTQPYRT